MSKRTIAATCAGAIACVGLGAFAATGLGDDPSPPADPLGSYEQVAPTLERSESDRARTLAKGKGTVKGKKAKKPRLTNLITSAPVAVAANEEIVAMLKCRPSQGVPVSGGAISPPAPAEVAISVNSRFNPNTLAAPNRRYFVGVRNLGDSPSSFYATLICGKGIKG